MEVNPLSSFVPNHHFKRNKAIDGLEQAFLTEILKHSGPKESSGQFGGGVGEAQFHSMLNDVYAESIARKIDLRLSLGKENHDV